MNLPKPPERFITKNPSHMGSQNTFTHAWGEDVKIRPKESVQNERKNRTRNLNNTIAPILLGIGLIVMGVSLYKYFNPYQTAPEDIDISIANVQVTEPVKEPNSDSLLYPQEREIPTAAEGPLPTNEEQLNPSAYAPDLPDVVLQPNEDVPQNPPGDGTYTTAPKGIVATKEITDSVVLLKAVNNNSQYINSCTGSVLSPHFVLTAAHCVQTGDDDEKGPGHQYDQIKVYPNGDSGPYDGVAAEGWYTSKAYTSQDDWEAWPSSVDYALIQLVEPLSDMEPVSLLQAGTPATKQLFYLGWGAHELYERNGSWEWEFKPDHNAMLNPVTLQTTKDCTRGYVKGYICAGPTFDPTWQTPARGTLCMGDSGGPLVAYENSKVYQIGIASAGTVGILSKHDISNDYPWAQCGFAPDMYTPTSPLIPWLKSVMALKGEAPQVATLSSTDKEINFLIHFK